MEFGQPEQRLRGPDSRPVRPSEALVPQEVMDHRDLDRQPRGQQVIQFQPGTKTTQRRQLHNDPDSTNGVELDPAKQCPMTIPLRTENREPRTVHEILSSR